VITAVESLCKEMASRKKAIAYGAKQFDFGVVDDVFRAIRQSIAGFSLQLYFNNQRYASVFTYSLNRKSAGKILLRIEDMPICRGYADIVSAYEATIVCIARFKQKNDIVSFRENATAIWHDLSLDIYTDCDRT
jgi:hypothetical protein